VLYLGYVNIQSLSFLNYHYKSIKFLMKKIKFKIKIYNKIILNKIASMKSKYIRQFNKTINKIIDFKDNYIVRINKFKKIKFHKFAKISILNKLLIFLISILFLYLFYLSSPTLYSKGILQKDFNKKILNEFKINISISSDISYSILPAPHFIVQNAKIFNNILNEPTEVSQIKKLKIYISQKNLLNQDNLNITKITIQDANFIIKKKDVEFINNFTREKFSQKKINIKNSKFFFKNFNNETISIFPINNLELFHDKKNFINKIKVEGKLFKIPFDFFLHKNFKKRVETISSLKLKKLNLIIKNIFYKEDKKKYGKNNIIFRTNKLTTLFDVQDNVINFNSDNLGVLEKKLSYKGIVKLSPFDLNLNIDLAKISLNKFFKYNPIFIEMFSSNLLFNKNLNAKIIFNSEKIVKNKLFDSVELLINFNNGIISFSNSKLIGKKIGIVNLEEGSLNFIDDQLIFSSSFKYNIKNENEFYKVFQTPKKTRIFLKDIFFDLEINLTTNKLKINYFNINEFNLDEKDSVNEILQNYNEANSTNNWIDFKYLVNKLIDDHEG